MTLLRQGRSDDAVERLTGVSLLRIIEMRAELASGPHRASRCEVTGVADRTRPPTLRN